MKNNILISGGRGLLGSEFYDLLGDRSSFFPDIQEMDITDIDSIRKYVQGKNISAIINCAAGRDAEYLEDYPLDAKKVNVDGPRYLSIVANEIEAVMVHISTDYVFDGKKSIPYVENDRVNPLSVYGITKAEGEQAVLQTAKTSAVFRTAWLFSYHGKDFVKTIKRVAESKPQIGVVFDQVGSPTYASDLACYILEVLPQIKPNTQELYHLTNDGVCSWYDLAYQIVKGFAISSEILPVHTHEYPTKAKRPAYSVLDKTKIKNAFGLKIRHYSEGLAECISKIKEQK